MKALSQVSNKKDKTYPLGLSPLNLNDAMAVPMFDIFTKMPDMRPFQLATPSKNLSDTDRQLYQVLQNKLK